MNISHRVNSKAVLLLIAVSLGAAHAHAKRLPPKEVSPVIYQGVSYSAPLWGWPKGKKENGEYVEARDAKTDKLLWELRIYKVQYDSKLEGDVQDVFITSLKLVDGNLEILNEAGDTFVVDLSKRQVIKGENRVYKAKVRSPRS